MVEQEPARYIFVPQYFIRLPLIDKVTGWISGGNSKEIILPLMKFNSSKYLQEQLEQDLDVVNGCSLSVQISLTSLNYSTNSIVNSIIEPFSDNQVLDIIGAIE